MMKIKPKYILLMFILIGQIPLLFYNSDDRIWLSIFHARGKTTRIDYFFIHYCTALNFILLSAILHFKKYVNKEITLTILILCILDFLHLLVFAKLKFSIPKIGLAFLIFILINYSLFNKK